MYRHYIKRIIDIIISFIVIMLLLPLFLILFFLVKTDSKGPFFFFQKRLGKNAKTFKVFKIRTMTNKERISHRNILKGDPEVTGVGNYLRRFKIDELPQFINVLCGDMSIVGPRPALPNQIDSFDENGKKRLLVRPGLTGLAQVNGNIYISWEERWKYDRKYVDNLSFSLDAKIIIKTILVVLFGEDKFK